MFPRTKMEGWFWCVVLLFPVLADRRFKRNMNSVMTECHRSNIVGKSFSWTCANIFFADGNRFELNTLRTRWRIITVPVYVFELLLCSSTHTHITLLRTIGIDRTSSVMSQQIFKHIRPFWRKIKSCNLCNHKRRLRCDCIVRLVREDDQGIAKMRFLSLGDFDRLVRASIRIPISMYRILQENHSRHSNTIFYLWIREDGLWEFIVRKS